MWRCKECGKTNIIKKSSGQARWIHGDLDEDGWVEEIYIECGEDINYVARSTEDGKVYISKE